MIELFKMKLPNFSPIWNVPYRAAVAPDTNNQSCIPQYTKWQYGNIQELDKAMLMIDVQRCNGEKITHPCMFLMALCQFFIWIVVASINYQQQNVIFWIKYLYLYKCCKVLDSLVREKFSATRKQKMTHMEMMELDDQVGIGWPTWNWMTNLDHVEHLFHYIKFYW